MTALEGAGIATTCDRCMRRNWPIHWQNRTMHVGLVFAAADVLAGPVQRVAPPGAGVGSTAARPVYAPLA